MNSPPRDCEVRLAFVDFWPTRIIPSVRDGVTHLDYEQFNFLFPKANQWLRRHREVDVFRCETVDRQLSADTNRNNASCDLQLAADDCQLLRSDQASSDGDYSIERHFVKGLRVWFRKPRRRKKPKTHADQIGYRNFIPRCRNSDSSTLDYEFNDLSDTFSLANEELLDRPLEGRIISVETVRLQLTSPDWDGSDIQVDESIWPDAREYHLLNITRVFYLLECPAYEQIGAADFLPDFPSSPTAVHSNDKVSTALVKVNSWLENATDIRIVNIATLAAALLEDGHPAYVQHVAKVIRRVCPSLADGNLAPIVSGNVSVNSAASFVYEADKVQFVKFLRVTYVRPKYGLPPDGLPMPSSVNYRTFDPASLSRSGGAEGTDRLENAEETWRHITQWLNASEERHLLSVETITHHIPTTLNQHNLNAECTMISNANSQQTQPVQCFRIYYEGNARSQYRDISTDETAQQVNEQNKEHVSTTATETVCSTSTVETTTQKCLVL